MKRKKEARREISKQEEEEGIKKLGKRRKKMKSKSSTESSDEPIEEGRGNAVKRAASWLQYFNSSGGEKTMEAPKHWMVNMSQLFLGKNFAMGTYSRLCHGFYKEKKVDVKMMRPPDEDEEVAGRLERQFHYEVLLLSRLHHQNIVQFVATGKKPPVYCVIAEYLSKGLRSFLHRSGPGPLSLKVIVGMALDIARGMEYLHSQGIIHRDLKSENFCLDDDLRVKITNFGVSCHYTECDNLTKDIETYRRMAPEMISHKPAPAINIALTYQKNSVLWIAEFRSITHYSQWH